MKKYKNFLITGGAGFIGSNLANRLLAQGGNVVIYDNFSRPNVEKNVAWLKSLKQKGKLSVIKADVRDFGALKKRIKNTDVVFHLAAQVAATTSVTDPRQDFEINVGGTINVLEAVRLSKKPPIVVYSSTNKVYGELSKTNLKNIGKGITENQPLDFHSPYGCSKGAADQYVRDYSRIYNIPTIVFRQSCIYGPRQFGVEDQGWLAHFAICALSKKPITIFGDGKQIRDLLYVEDLIDAYLLAVENINKCNGEIFNIGGGKENNLSLIQSIKLLEKYLDTKIKLNFQGVRPGDQNIFISDNTKLKKVLGFAIKTRYSDGLERLIAWLTSQVKTTQKVQLEKKPKRLLK